MIADIYFQDEDRFVILTTDANDSMRPVRDRMPLILPERDIEDWIFEDDMVREFLGKASSGVNEKCGI